MTSLDRGNSKHAPHVDEALAAASTAGSRSEEWRSPDDDIREPESVTPDAGGAGAPDGMTPEDVERRSRLGRYIPLAALPGDRHTLRRGAESLHAPDDILDQLARLPEGRQYETVSQIWAALGHPNESHRS